MSTQSFKKQWGSANSFLGTKRGNEDRGKSKTKIHVLKDWSMREGRMGPEWEGRIETSEFTIGGNKCHAEASTGLWKHRLGN